MKFTAMPSGVSEDVLMLAGGVNVGALFMTVTVNEPSAVKPPLSVTVQFTVVVPIAKVDPDAGAQSALMTPSSMSLPVAAKITAAPAALVAGVTMFAGGVNDGPLFMTVTVNEPSAVKPPLSVTVQFTVV
ncbi:MAG TPA: hypothetical protein VFZ31_08830, partial [Vicinamibacterales bacterium]